MSQRGSPPKCVGLYTRQQRVGQLCRARRKPPADLGERPPGMTHRLSSLLETAAEWHRVHRPHLTAEEAAAAAQTEVARFIAAHGEVVRDERVELDRLRHRLIQELSA